MTSQRAAKKANRSKELVLVADSWAAKLQAAIWTGRAGIIYAQLTAWEADDPQMSLEAGEDHRFVFNPAQVARRRQIAIKLRRHH